LTTNTVINASFTVVVFVFVVVVVVVVPVIQRNLIRGDGRV
jgi:hypothetical protein